MKQLPLIPAPPSVKWRNLRVVWVPMIVFAIGTGASIMLWQNVGTNWTISGVGEGVRSLLSSPQSALVHQILVQPYQVVEQGDPIAILVPADPRAQLDLLRSELDLTRLRFQPSIAEENAMSFERIRVDVLKTKAELAIARVKLELAEKDVARNAPLYKEKLVSEDIFELSVNLRDVYQVEVAEKAKAIAEIEGRLEGLRNLGDPILGERSEPLAALLSKLERAHVAAATNLAPITLRAPVAGMIGTIQRQPGEYVVAGEPLVFINSLWSDRVVGYLRQPYTVDPKVGMPVFLTTRTHQRQRFQAQITQVGAQIESITNSLAYLRPGFLTDAGLPIIVTLPIHIRIRPGEVVDMLVRPKQSDDGPGVNPTPEAWTRSKTQARL